MIIKEVETRPFIAVYNCTAYKISVAIIHRTRALTKEKGANWKCVRRVYIDVTHCESRRKEFGQFVSLFVNFFISLATVCSHTLFLYIVK